MEMTFTADARETAPAIGLERAVPVRRVLFVITTTDFGGAESLLERLAATLDRQLFEPVVCSLCPLGQIGQRIAEGGVATFSLGMAPGVRLGQLLTGAFRLASQVDRRGIDLIHSQLYRANVLSALASRLARRRPVLVQAQHSLTAARGRLTTLAAWATRPLAHKVIAVSEAVRERLTGSGGVSAARVVVIQNGVDTDRYRPGGGEAVRAELGFAPGTLVVGGVGRLAPVKGFDLLLEAVAGLLERGVPAGAVLVGEGPDREALEAQASRLGLGGAVRFLGVRGDLDAIYPALDVFVLSSLREASPMALLESMSCGCAVVAARVGGVPEIVEDGCSGLFFDRDEPGALTEALALLAAEPGRRRQLGEGARRRIEARFGVAAVVREHESLYRELLTVCGEA